MKTSGKVRVTSGSAGGLWIKVPKHFPSRPTQDRVKQAIFSSLGGKITDARVLDVFAGTGSLGIEALSRGAASCTFVEKDRNCCPVIQENLEYCHLHGTVICRSVETYCKALTPERFDVILADPPYTKSRHNLGNDPVILALVSQLTPDGILVWEHDSRNYWEGDGSWELLKTASYGETTVSYLGPGQNQTNSP